MTIFTRKTIFFLFASACISIKSNNAIAQQTHRYTLASHQPPALTADAGADIFSTQGDTVTLGGDVVAEGGTAPYSYSWTPSEGLPDSKPANPDAIAGPSDITYTVTVTDAAGCTATDDATLFVNITSLAANGEVPFAIYPNPARAWLTIRSGESSGTVTLFDSRGQLVLKEPLASVEHRIDIRSLSKGIYFLQITDEQEEYTVRVCIQ